jgi:hypothetical protein
MGPSSLFADCAGEMQSYAQSAPKQATKASSPNFISIDAIPAFLLLTNQPMSG